MDANAATLDFIVMCYNILRTVVEMALLSRVQLLNIPEIQLNDVPFSDILDNVFRLHFCRRCKRSD